MRLISLHIPVSQVAPVQPSLQLHVSGDMHVPCMHGIVQIAIVAL